MRFEPLSGMDAGFLYMETPTLHMHTLKVVIMRPPEPGTGARGSAAMSPQTGVTLPAFRHALESRLAALPVFRQRVLEIPFGLGHPVWVPDRHFDLSHHIGHVTAPAPGGWRELNVIVSEIASRPLSRDRPLWEITMVDGLERQRIAFVCKLHHCMADGAAAMAMLLDVFASVPGDIAAEPRAPVSGDMAAEPRAPVPAIGEVDSEVPTRADLMWWAFGRGLRNFGGLPRLLLHTLRGLFNLVRRLRAGTVSHAAVPFSGPRTQWSGALTARRSFATTRLPLADMKRVKDALGVTLNDVMLAICGAALRGHLQEVEGAIPNEPLVASVPINTHPELVGRARGNRVGHLTASLCTDIADPLARIRTIHEMMDEAKQRQMALGADLLERWVEYVPPKPYSATVRFWSQHGMADRLPSPINLVVSNVRGPKQALDIAGSRLEALFSVGPILEGAGLNITGWSYADQVFFVGLACPDQIADVQALIDRLPRALDELLAASDREGSAAAQPSRSAGPSASGEVSRHTIE